MNLVQRDTVYNYMSFELLESMIELSRINTDRFQSTGMDRDYHLSASMTSFSTGRQTGKSTAISRYFKENENVIVVSPTKTLQKIMAERLQSINKFNLCVADFKNSNASNIFRGLRGKFDLIFDECSLDDILFCLDRLGTHSGVKIQSIVKVGVR